MGWCHALLIVAGGALLAVERPATPATRYACVAASAALVSEYFGRTERARGDLFERLGVKDDGSAPVGALMPLFAEMGLHCRALENLAPWYTEQYLSNPACCAVLVTAGNGRRLRHSLVLFPGRDGVIAMSDLVTPPRMCYADALKGAMGRGAILIVVSEDRIPSPAYLHLRRYVAAYGAAVVLASAVFLVFRRKFQNSAPKGIP